MHRSIEGYRPLRDESQDSRPASWTKFYVSETGKCQGAHLKLVDQLKATGLHEVMSPAECDFLLVICPVVSRTGTNITEALASMPPGKPVILVVMHHTFNNKHVVVESKRQVSNPNVCLTVDYLFYEGALLKSACNDIAWYDIQKFLHRLSVLQRWMIPVKLSNELKWIIGISAVVFVGISVGLIMYYVLNK